MEIEKQIKALLIYCCKHEAKKELWETAITQLVAFGPDAVPFLVDAVISSDWECATWAAYALGRFGVQAADAVPALFLRIQDADHCQEDMFGLAAFHALVHIGERGLKFLRHKALSQDSGERRAAFGIMLEILPRDRKTFEYFKERLRNGDAADQSFLVGQIISFADFREEAVLSIDNALYSSDKDVKYYSANVLGLMRARGELPEEYWEKVMNDPDPTIRELLSRVYAAHSKASVFPPPN
jgi:hypothetical protein